MIKKKRILLITSIAIISFALIVLLVLIFVAIFTAININYNNDDELFLKSKSFNSTSFYADSNPYDDEYTPTKVELSGSIKKMYTKLEEITPLLVDGFIAVEDRNFYRHNGVDLKRTLSAAANYIFRTKKLFGASTITQQVVKNISGDNDLSVSRKFSEILRAYHIERTFSKREIIELYLNIIPMSEGIFGVAEAAKNYFGKDADNLSTAEVATLIGITNAPSAYNPYNNPQKCMKKRNLVLGVMYSEGIIAEREYRSSIAEELKILPKESREDLYDSWFVENVIDSVASDMSQKRGISVSAARLLLLEGGYSVYTTMDRDAQMTLERYFENEGNFSPEIKNGLNYSMVVCDSRNGNLLALVGGVGKKKGNRLLNHATVPHAPASALKPIALYAPLLDEGKINWATVFDDVPVEFTATDEGYKPFPRNSPNVYSGLTTVKDAIKYSKNTVAVRLCIMRTPEKVFKALRDIFGFESLVEGERTADGRVLSDVALSPMSLGQLTRGVSLMKLTESYGVFPSEGILKKMRNYLWVTDYEGNVVLKNENVEDRVFSRKTARIMNKLLMNVTNGGTADKIRLKSIVETAGKTGTSGNNRDKTFVGYTPYYVAGIWCGYESANSSTASLYPTHLDIWDDVMCEIHKSRLINEETADRFSDDELLYLPYCMDSGKLYCDFCMYDVRGSRCEYGYFTNENKPDSLCDRHVKVAYDTISKGIAGVNCDDSDLVTISLINIRDRDFPIDVIVTDAEFVYRDLSGYQSYPSSDEYPYFYYDIPEGHYVGRSKKKKQFNSGCMIH